MKAEFFFGSESKIISIPENSKFLDKIFKEKEFDSVKIFSKIDFKGKKIGILVPDITRPFPARELLEKLAEKIKDKKITIFIANGTHRKPTEHELKGYLGKFFEKYPVIINDPQNEKIYKKIGITKYGTEVEILSQLLEQDELLALTLVRPHYYAGFSGGRKIFLPGVSSYKTIQQNHKLVLDSDPEKGKNPYAVLGSLEKNPVHNDMMEVLNLIPIPFKILNFVISGKKILFCSFDFFKSVDFFRKKFQLFSKEKFDTLIVSAGGYPSDINFIQGHKALEHSIGGLKEGGKIFAYIEATEGFGSNDCIDFLKIGSIEGIVKKLREDFKIYGHTALTILIKSKKFDIHLCTNLKDEDLRLMGYKRWDGKSLPENLGKVGIIKQASIFYFEQT